MNTASLVLGPRVASRRVNPCRWAMAKTQLGCFHALKIYQNPSGRSFFENTNLHFIFEHLTGDSVYYLRFPVAALVDVVWQWPASKGTCTSLLPPERVSWEGPCLPDMLEFQLRFCLIIVELGSNKMISSFVDGAPSVLNSACLLCPFLFSWLSSWHLIRNPLILAGAGQPFALSCKEKLPAQFTSSNVPVFILVSVMQILSTDVNASLVLQSGDSNSPQY